MKREGTVNAVSLCTAPGVSSVTICNDLKLLEDKNMLYRTHGGAAMTNPYTAGRPVNEKAMIRAEEKPAIGEAAARLVEVNDCILIASCTTVLSLAKNIHPKGNITVITGALNVAQELNHNPAIEVILPGGLMRKAPLL